MALADAYPAWQQVTGLAIEPERLEYYRVLVLVRMAISCDATIVWKDGVEDDSIRTQVLLRPWLGLAISAARDLAGCLDPGLPALRRGAGGGPLRRLAPRLPARHDPAPRAPGGVPMLSAADDGFHPVADPDPLWTETTWWGFMVPERSLGWMLYTLFRPNLGVASGRRPGSGMPARSNPGSRRTPDSCGTSPTPPVTSPTARWVGCGWSASSRSPPTGCGSTTTTSCRSTSSSAPCRRHTRLPVGGGSGHLDQAGRVHGQLVVGGEAIVVDVPGLRDRSWYVREDRRRLRAYTYAVVDEGEHLVVHSRGVPGGGRGRDARARGLPRARRQHGGPLLGTRGSSADAGATRTCWSSRPPMPRAGRWWPRGRRSPRWPASPRRACSPG